MTNWVEFPLRPQGQPWPGLNTRGGRLDPGQGYLEDGSKNAVINESDILEKRKGIIRGLNERFDGVVCGLFRYTDECGVEYVIVADQTSIKVRTPFDIPTFLGSDSLPNDGFTQELDTTRWNNTTDYETFLGALQLKGSSESVSDAFIPTTRMLEWFKPSVLTSYQVEIEYNMVAESVGQQVAGVIIKRTGTTYLEADVVLTPTGYSVALYLVQNGTRTTLSSSNLGGSTLAEGFLRLGYNATTRTATLRAIPSGGSQVTLSAQLNELQDSGLGQNSAIGLTRAGLDLDEVQIESVTGSSL